MVIVLCIAAELSPSRPTVQGMLCSGLVVPKLNYSQKDVISKTGHININRGDRQTRKGLKFNLKLTDKQGMMGHSRNGAWERQIRPAGATACKNRQRSRTRQGEEGGGSY